jgi:hypothetical protein
VDDHFARELPDVERKRFMTIARVVLGELRDAMEMLLTVMSISISPSGGSAADPACHAMPNIHSSVCSSASPTIPQ